LKEGAQSLWSPYVHLKNEQKVNENIAEKGTKFTTKLQNNRLRNGELVLAVARQVILDCCISVDSMSSLFDVDISSVKRALKKIKEKLSAGHIIPGFSSMEMNNITRAMAERAHSSRNNVSNNEKLRLIVREFESGKSLPEIAGIVGFSIKKLREIIKDAGFDVGKLAIKMVWEGSSISEAALHLGLKAKEVTEIIAKDKLFSEIVCKKVIENDLGIAEIARDSGFSKKGFMQKLKESGSGDIISSLARFLSRIGKEKDKISQLLDTSEDKIRKMIINRRIVVRFKDIRPAPNKDSRPGISTMKPAKPKNRRESKRPATISRVGLAEWCMQHYENGILQLPDECVPSDLPKRYPKVELAMFIPDKPRSTIIPAPPLSKAESTARGRNRIGYLKLY